MESIFYGLGLYCGLFLAGAALSLGVWAGITSGQTFFGPWKMTVVHHRKRGE